MTNRITIELTEKKWNDVVRGVSYCMEDYMDDYMDDPNSYEAKYNRRVKKVNAYYQRLIDEIEKKLAKAKTL